MKGRINPQTVKIWADIMRPSYEDHQAILRQFEADATQEHCVPETFSKYKAQVIDLPHSIERMKLKQERSVRMSCWHGNEGESEAMWKLYGDWGTVAVVTTVSSLAESVSVEGINEVVDIVPVKYLDFDREYVPTELKDFRGRITATKRLAYQHEQEVRLTIRPVTQNPMDWEQTDFGQPNPIRLPIDVNKLIHEIRVHLIRQLLSSPALDPCAKCSE